MATVYKISYYAMYVIGKVESNWNWQSVNYNDPITIGMMQWYGTRAAGLLNRMRQVASNDYAKLAQTLRDDLSSHGVTDTYWNRRYLTKEEGNSFKAASESRTSHLAQEELAIHDFTGYISTLSEYGFVNSVPRPLVFAMCMYHQSPAAALRVIRNTPNIADLDSIYHTCMSDGTLGKYTNRYNTAYSMLKQWDGESDPPDFGQSGIKPDPSPDPDPEKPSGSLAGSYIMERGSDLILYQSGNKSGVIFHASAGGRWISTSKISGGGDTPEPQPPVSNTAEKIMQLLYDYKDKFKYGQGAGRLDPEVSGHTDCSGLVWWAYMKIANINPGEDTKSQISKATSQNKMVVTGTSSNVIPIDQLKLADLILMDWGDGTRHVELYNGNDTTWGIREGYGPNQWHVKVSQLNTRVVKWWVARWL